MSEFVTQFETADGIKKYDFQSLGNFPAMKKGQFMRVTAVDENGQPTAWEPVYLSEEFLPLEGGIMVGTMQVPKVLFDRANGAHGDAGIYKNNEAGDGTLQLMDRAGNNNFIILSLNGSEKKLSVTTGKQNEDGTNSTDFVGGIYHEGNKPTADDVGALSKTGGEISGDLTIKGNGKAFLIEDTDSNGHCKIYKNASSSADYGLALYDYGSDESYAALIIRNDMGRLFFATRDGADGATSQNEVYHRGNITFGTTDLTAGTSELPAGHIHFVYE